jgi:hypothetical protein
MPLNPQALECGHEQYETYLFDLRPGKPAQKRVQYDYRTPSGELFSCVAPNVKAARAKRNVWIKERTKVQISRLLSCGLVSEELNPQTKKQSEVRNV